MMEPCEALPKDGTNASASTKQRRNRFQIAAEASPISAILVKSSSGSLPRLPRSYGSDKAPGELAPLGALRVRHSAKTKVSRRNANSVRNVHVCARCKPVG